MKGYKDNLREFIDYVLKKYSKDCKVQQFKEVYEKQEYKREQTRAKLESGEKTRYIRISLETADVCKKLVESEVQRDKILNVYDRIFKTKLLDAHRELQDFGYDSISRLLEVMRNNG